MSLVSRISVGLYMVGGIWFSWSFFFFFFSLVLIYPDSLFSYFTIIILSVMTAVTFPLRLPRLAFAICGWRWQNDMHEIKYSVSERERALIHRKRTLNQRAQNSNQIFIRLEYDLWIKEVSF